MARSVKRIDHCDLNRKQPPCHRDCESLCGASHSTHHELNKQGVRIVCIRFRHERELCHCETLQRNGSTLRKAYWAKSFGFEHVDPMGRVALAIPRGAPVPVLCKNSLPRCPCCANNYLTAPASQKQTCPDALAMQKNNLAPLPLLCKKTLAPLPLLQKNNLPRCPCCAKNKLAPLPLS